jgi:hypothetical protein
MGMHKKIFNIILKSLEQGIKLPVNHNTIHSNGEIFEILLQTSFLHQCIETTVQQRGFFVDGVCSADTVIKRINTYGWERILVDLKAINEQQFKEWIDKPKGNVYVAVDYHDIPRYIQKKLIGNRVRKNAMMLIDSFIVRNNAEPIVFTEFFPRIL